MSNSGRHAMLTCSALDIYVYLELTNI